MAQVVAECQRLLQVVKGHSPVVAPALVPRQFRGLNLADLCGSKADVEALRSLLEERKASAGADTQLVLDTKYDLAALEFKIVGCKVRAVAQHVLVRMCLCAAVSVSGCHVSAPRFTARTSIDSSRRVEGAAADERMQG